jgi:hypothetical protein
MLAKTYMQKTYTITISTVQVNQKQMHKFHQQPFCNPETPPSKSIHKPKTGHGTIGLALPKGEGCFVIEWIDWFSSLELPTLIEHTFELGQHLQSAMDRKFKQRNVENVSVKGKLCYLQEN